MKKCSEKTLALLEAIADIASQSATIAETCFTPGLILYKDIWERFRQIERRKIAAKERRRLKARFYQMVRRLKESGIIEKRGVGLILTALGQKKLADLADYYRNKQSIRSYKELSRKTGKAIVIIFDIPEEWKWKRDWFRAVLVELGFAMLQKSVWKGEYAIPEQLLTDLKKLRLLPYVKFFTIENMVEI